MHSAPMDTCKDARGSDQSRAEQRLGSSEIFGFDPMPARTRLALALLLARRGRAEEAIGEGAPPGRRCSGDQYRNGSWVQIDNKTFRYP